MRIRRHRRGSVLIFVMSLIAMVIVVGVCAIFMMTMFGGSCQLQNSTDAGALSVARRCLTEINVPAEQANSTFFDDVANADHEINLENLNYCMAKAMLVQINQAAMLTQGEATDKSNRTSFEVFSAAKRISTQLASDLGSLGKISPLFLGVARSNSTRMLGQDSVELQPHFDRAYLDRGDKSSVYFDPDSIPAGFNATELKAIDAQGKKWLPGYLPLDIGARGFNFVPQPIKPPHLVSERYFVANIESPQSKDGHKSNDFLPVVPNAYRLIATVGGKMKNTSCSQADSVRDGVVMEMPHGFVRFVQPAPVFTVKQFSNENGKWGTDMKYKPRAGDVIMKVFAAIRPKLDKLPTAWDVFVSQTYAEQLKHFKAVLAQRSKEILPHSNFGESDPPLADVSFGEEDKMYMFKGEKKIQFRSERQLSDILAHANWLPPIKDRETDGMGNPTDSDIVTRTTYEWDLPRMSQAPIAARIMSFYSFKWVPSTGANNVLGELELSRRVQVDFLADGPQPDRSKHKDDPPVN